MKKLRSLELCLENCEIIKFPNKYLRGFFLDEITETLRFYNYDDPRINRSFYASDFRVEILPDANTMDSFVTDYPNKRLPFERLQEWPDITCISLNFNRDSEVYYLPWKGTDENNTLQKTRINNNGSLIIRVKKSTTPA